MPVTTRREPLLGPSPEVVRPVAANTLSTLECTRCGHRFPAGVDAFACPACHEGLVLVADRGLGHARPLARPASVWDFAAVLPAVPAAYRTTLGEGGTPLISLSDPHLHREVWVKNEGVGPTQSYKDRFNAVNVSVARAMGFRGVALISTGNAGLAAAAYGAAAGLEVRVICPPGTPELIARGIAAFGAELVVSPRGGARAMLDAALADGFFPGSRSVPASGVTPFGAEGYKTIAYEIVAALGRPPDVVIVPVGGGDGIYGIQRGFAEMKRAGDIPSIPRMVGVRTNASLAPSIAFDQVGWHAVACVQRSGGSFVNVTADQILAAVAALNRVGISAEPASAASVAALVRDVATIDDQVVCVVTGGGLKWGEVLDGR
ncbi:MAG TPA: pyridoxal-phosphate dependent enzyme [Dermatophilaceae bacterium]